MTPAPVDWRHIVAQARTMVDDEEFDYEYQGAAYKYIDVNIDLTAVSGTPDSFTFIVTVERLFNRAILGSTKTFTPIPGASVTMTATGFYTISLAPDDFMDEININVDFDAVNGTTPTATYYIDIQGKG